MMHERIFQLATLIEPMDSKFFDLSSWRHMCGTPSCIAGHAAWLAMYKEPHEKVLEEARKGNDFEGHYGTMIARYNNYDAHALAADWLGLDSYQSTVLFVPSIRNLRMGMLEPDPIPLSNGVNDRAREKVSGKWAARTLRHLAATGIVDWTRVREDA